MALSKDLREYLDKKMNEELKEIDNRVNDLVKTNTEEAFKTDPVTKIAAELYTDIVNKAGELNELCGFSFGYGLNFKKGTQKLPPNSLVPREVARKGVDELLKTKDEIINKYESLKLRLSLEKKFENINQILTEAGIGL